MTRTQSLTPAYALALSAMAASAFPASAAPQNSTLDAQIEHAVSGCESVTPGKTAFGFVPPGFDYRFTVTSPADAHPLTEAHRKFVGYWEKSFRKPVVPGTDVSELKRELRLTGSKAAAWLVAEESEIDDFLKEYKPGKTVTYEVALLGCTGSAGAFDAIMALKEFEVETD
jgi:hypothetical protein